MPSEIRVDNINSTASPYDPVFSTTGGALSHRNMMINGAMQVYQRGSLSITQSNNGGYALDRFRYSQNAAMGQWVGTMSQDALSDADIVTTGQRNALKVLTTTVENAIGADEESRLIYTIEAQDCQRLLYGTSAAKSSTLSFWAKSTVAGDYAVSIYQPDGTDIIGSKYTLTANTWTNVSITFAGNTLENIANDNTAGLQLQFMLIAGGNYTSADNTSWGAYAANKIAYGHTASSISNPWGTNASDAWYITGVQLELGSVATPFEHRSHADELRRCQRYYYKPETGTNGYLGSGHMYETGTIHLLINHPVTMRTASATVESDYGSQHFYLLETSSTNSYIATNWSFTLNGENNSLIQAGSVSNMTLARPVNIKISEATAYVAISAEL